MYLGGDPELLYRFVVLAISVMGCMRSCSTGEHKEAVLFSRSVPSSDRQFGANEVPSRYTAHGHLN